MKILVLVAHPFLKESKINKVWLERLSKEENITVVNLYEQYPNYEIDVDDQQRLLLAHDRIVFQFPMYWYSCPSLLTKWQDDVLEYGFAYGSTGDKLYGKDFMIVTSIGGPKEAYQAGGYNQFTLSEILRPFQAMANLTGMEYLPIYALHSTRALTEQGIKENAETLVEYINRVDFKTK